MSLVRAVLRTLRNLWAGLLHGHPAQCRTVWSAHGATYCWLCECSVTDDPVPGYVLVDRASGEIARGRRGGVPTPAFFTSHIEAVNAWALAADRFYVCPAVADTKGVRTVEIKWTALEEP